jgi:hypothetical protein
MIDKIYSLFNISIDFSNVQWFFPKIISALLVITFFLVIIKKRSSILAGIKQGTHSLSGRNKDFHRGRVFGTILLIAIYFYGMNAIGNLFPNTGYGFLLASIPFTFLLSLLYVDTVTLTRIMFLLVNAIISPCIIWLLFGRLFSLPLP